MTFLSQCITSCQILYGYRTMNVRVSQDFIPSRLYTCTCTSILLFILKQNSLLVLKIKRRKMPFSTYSATSKLLKSNEKKRDFYKCTECSKAWLGFSNKDHVIWSNTENYIISIAQVYSIHMHMMSKYMNMQFSANTLRRIRPILYSRKENSVHIKYALWAHWTEAIDCKFNKFHDDWPWHGSLWPLVSVPCPSASLCSSGTSQLTSLQFTWFHQSLWRTVSYESHVL